MVPELFTAVTSPLTDASMPVAASADVIMFCRCSLCSGMGSVGWEGKWSHKEPCPLCLGHRFVSCATCGGKFHRRMFSHIHSQKLNADDAFAYVERGVQKLTD